MGRRSRRKELKNKALTLRQWVAVYDKVMKKTREKRDDK